MKSRIALVMLVFSLIMAAGITASRAADWNLGAGVADVPDDIGSDNDTVTPVPRFKSDFDNHMSVHVLGGHARANFWSIGKQLEESHHFG